MQPVIGRGAMMETIDLINTIWPYISVPIVIGGIWVVVWQIRGEFRNARRLEEDKNDLQQL